MSKNRNVDNTQTKGSSHHVENVSRMALDKYHEIVSEYTAGKNGIYILYHNNKYYQAGLVRDLKHRIPSLLEDSSWDSFSIYLTDNTSLEHALKDSIDMKEEFRRRISAAQQRDLQHLFEGENTKPGNDEQKSRKAKKRKSNQNVLSQFVKKPLVIRMWYKGGIHSANVEKNGSIVFKGKTFTSPSVAAQEIYGRVVNGWTVWKFEKSPGEWVILDELRKTA